MVPTILTASLLFSVALGKRVVEWSNKDGKIMQGSDRLNQAVSEALAENRASGSSTSKRTAKAPEPFQTPAQSYTRAAFNYSFSCLPIFNNGRRICGSRNPLLLDEVAETEEENAQRLKQFEVDYGNQAARKAASVNIKIMDEQMIRAFITLEAGHVAECAAERALLAEGSFEGVTDANSANAWKTARSCGDDAVGWQNQGNTTILKEASQDLTYGHGDKKWALVPVPDGVSIRIPYFRLFSKLADEFFDSQCGTHGVNDCRVMTHCIGGNGRTGAMMMSYWLMQLDRGNVDTLTGQTSVALDEYMSINVPASLSPMHTHFKALRKEYYKGNYDAFKDIENDCTKMFCDDEFLANVMSQAILADVDKYDHDKLWARCKKACSICENQGLDKPYKKDDLKIPPLSEKQSKGEYVYAPGNHMPRAVMEAIVTVTIVRGLKAGEFFHVTAEPRPPGQCMRMVQWWHCLEDPDFSIKYNVNGLPPLRLDCKDFTPFSPNEFGVYQNWKSLHSLETVSQKDGTTVGPEENIQAWKPTAHEMGHNGSEHGPYGGAAVAACAETEDDTLECLLKPETQQAVRNARTREPGWIEMVEANQMAISIPANVTVPRKSKFATSKTGGDGGPLSGKAYQHYLVATTLLIIMGSLASYISL